MTFSPPALLLASILAAFMFASAPDGLAAEPVGTSAYLVKDGASPYRIVLEPSASPSERHAAEELRKFFNACTGIDLPVADAGTPVDAPMIVLGCGPVARKLGVDPSPALLGEQGYMMRTVPPHIVVAGTAAAGTLYGVYDFLEDQLGVRWYAPDTTHPPRSGISRCPISTRQRARRFSGAIPATPGRAAHSTGSSINSPNAPLKSTRKS